MTMDLNRLLDDIDRLHGVIGVDDVRVALTTMAKELIAQCDAAWLATSTASSRGDEITEAWERSKAHTLCNFLGDQESLAHKIYRSTA